MTLKELGELLRREREAKGLSVKQVMEDTKISRRILVALEEGDRASLPHPVYTKGFVRNYARLLGLGEADLAQVIDEEFGTGEEELPTHPRPSVPRRANGAVASTGKRSWPTVLLIIVLVGVLAAMIVYLQRKAMLGKVMHSAPVEQQQAAPATPAAPEVPAAPEPEAQPQETHPAPAPAAPAPAKAPAAAVPAPAPAATPAPVPAAAQAEQAAPSKPGVQTVVITAKTGQMCWMEASADGKDKKEYFIRSGESVTFEYMDKFTVKLGNVGGVTVTRNGKLVPTDGAGWTVKTLTFP